MLPDHEGQVMLRGTTYCTCAEYFVENPARIGGNRVIVEIDETFLARYGT